MKRIMTLALGVLLLSSGLLTAAEKKSAREPTGTPTSQGIKQKLDLNLVSLEQLVGVPGIGPRIAEAILDLRKRKGSFSKVEDLLEVSGIKEKKLASIAGYLEVVPLPTPLSKPLSGQSR